MANTTWHEMTPTVLLPSSPVRLPGLLGSTRAVPWSWCRVTAAPLPVQGIVQEKLRECVSGNAWIDKCNSAHMMVAQL